MPIIERARRDEKPRRSANPAHLRATGSVGISRAKLLGAPAAARSETAMTNLVK
jgi:hypothetical protein